MKNVLSRDLFKGKKLFEEQITQADALLLSKIDYTLLNPESTEKDIIKLCEKANLLGVKSVCVLPKMVRLASEELKDSKVLVCTVVSFPHGTDSTSTKLAETKRVIADGADEVDMVLNYPLLKHIREDYENIYKELIEDVSTLVEECHKHKNKEGNLVILKVIVESGLLNQEQTQLATNICYEADADFIKTSTGMVEVGAELNKVHIMKNVINYHNSKMKIKASGEIRTMSQIKQFEPFVDRFGIGSNSVDNIFAGKK